MTTPAAAAPPPASPVRDAFGILLVALAIAVAIVGIAFRPAILTPCSVVLALASVIASARWRQYAAVAVVVAGLAWFAGMTIALFTQHPLY